MLFRSIFGCVGSSVRARAFSSYGKWGPLFIAVQGPLFIAVRGPLTITASPVAGHRLQTRRLSSCGSRAQLLRGMWDLSRPGLEPVSPALAGRFSTTAPPGKPLIGHLNIGQIWHELSVTNFCFRTVKSNGNLMQTTYVMLNCVPATLKKQKEICGLNINVLCHQKYKK